MFLSGHPVMPYQKIIRSRHYVTSGKLRESSENFSDGQKIHILGVITQIKIKTTKSNHAMARLTLEDLEGSVEILLFPKTLSRYENMLHTYEQDHQGSIVVIDGSLDLKEEGIPRILCDNISLPENPAQLPKETRLFLKVASENSEAYRQVIACLLAAERGTCCVMVRFSSTGILARLGEQYAVTPNQQLLVKLQKILGKDFVVLQ